MPHRRGDVGSLRRARASTGKLFALTYGEVSLDRRRSHREEAGLPLLSRARTRSRSAAWAARMRCGHCQNWQISRETGRRGTPRECSGPPAGRGRGPRAAPRLRGRGVHLQRAGHLGSSTCSTSSEAARRRASTRSWSRTATSREQGLDLLGEFIDVWRVDVKGFRTRRTGSCARSAQRDAGAAEAERAKKHWGMHVEVVTNVVPTINDDEETLAGIASWIADSLGPETAWHVTRFFPYLEFAHLPPTPIATLPARSRDRARGGPLSRLPRQRRRARRRGHGLSAVRRRRSSERTGFSVRARPWTRDDAESAAESIGIVT